MLICKKIIVVIMKKKTKQPAKAKKSNAKRTIVFLEEFMEYKDNPLFCTECDHDLDTFWLSERSRDPDAVRKNHQRCVETGKFRGELCAKMFIINDSDVDEVWLKDD
ncbi:MAG: hypothetical protein N2490_03535 [Ignavibacteria bacterium]|nr:hypothetical protein [Ignavibacteria bacterium]